MADGWFPFYRICKTKVYAQYFCVCDTYLGFQWTTALSSEKPDYVITCLLEIMAIMGISAKIKLDNAPTYVYNKMKQFFAYYNINQITGISHNTTGQAIIERTGLTLKEMLIKQKGREKTPGTDK